MPSITVKSIVNVLTYGAITVAVVGVTTVVIRDRPWDKAEPVTVTVEPEAAPAPSGNPLLTAKRHELEQWFPLYCGADLFYAAGTDQRKINQCVAGVIERVQTDRGVRLNPADVLDPAVRAHWRTTMLPAGER